MDPCSSKVVEKAVDLALDATIRQVDYIYHYKEHVEKLKQKVEDLESAGKGVEHEVNRAEDNLDGIEAGVREWLKDADGKVEECNKFLGDEGHTKTGCSRGILPFLWYRRRLGRKAFKRAEEVNNVLTRKPERVSCQQNPKYENIDIAGYVEFGSRKKTMEEIMGKLKDSTVRMIGVHGPGGVGKTTLVKEIAKKAGDNNLFDVVVMVNITRNPNRQNIQEEIAYRLGLTFHGEGENVRADSLRTRLKLKQERESVLVILDDLWDALDLNMLGIPLGDDDVENDLINKMVKNRDSPGVGDNDVEKDLINKMEKKRDFSSVYKGCKILLTSRIRYVLSDKMNVKGDSIFTVSTLADEEAVKLFKKVAEIPDENSKFNQDIVKKYCAGLPVTIITLGRALRNKSESVWEDVVEKFRRQELIGVQNSMEISVKTSYDHLESEELKSIFLLAAQVGHQPLIMDLVTYCFGLGILKGVSTLTDAHDRISKSIQKLKDSSLMSDSNSSYHFNMHDMVRDAALSIAHRDQNVFTLRNDKLDDWPDELERCNAISIYKSDITDDLPEVIDCPQLRVFHIDSDDPSLNIPDRFFEGMPKLKVLILAGIDLQSLPSSIKCLTKLRMLCFERCVLGNFSIIGDLKKLRILSLSGSKIVEWPTELGGLSKVQLLDISDCYTGNMVPPSLISSMTSLEELYIRKSLIKREVEGGTNQSQISVLSELKHLHQLKTIDVCIPSADVLPKDVFFDKLNDYKIVIGDFETLSVGDFKMPRKYEASRSLALQLKTRGSDIHSLNGIKMLFRRVENLLLGELNGVQNAFYELNLDGFPHLKHLSIINNPGIEYIVDSMELSHPQNVFPILESFNLFNVMNIKKICCGAVSDATFSRLKTVKVKMCTQLKNLFSLYIVKFLTSLETIDVSQCDYLEEIVVEEGGAVSDKVEFRKLCSLTLQELPSFISFYASEKMLSEPQLMDGQAGNTEIACADEEQSVTTCISLFGEKVVIPNLESLELSSINVHNIWSDQLSSVCFENLIKLTVKDCPNLTYLCPLSVACNLKKLKGLTVSGCQKMEKLFSTEGNSRGYSQVCIFPNLEEIQLTHLEMLKDIWPAEVSADSFSGLVSVHIEWCKKLDKIFPSHMEGWYHSLDSLKVVACESVEVIFETRCTPQKNALGADTRLQLILLEWLESLKHVWSIDQEGVVNFTNLRSIKVRYCEKLSYILPVSVAKGLGKLEDFSVESCDEMEEIVAWVEGSETSKPLEFSEVTSMEFCYLRKIRHFYMGSLGRHAVECPKLKQLTVNNCAKLEIFTTEGTNKQGRPVFLAEKVISNLEYMHIGSKEAEWLKSNIGKYHMLCLKHLRLQSLPSVEILHCFLHRIPNLEKLDLDSPDIQELVLNGNAAPQQRLGTVLQLKELALYFSSIKDIGFERDFVLQRIERLVLYWCRELISVAQPSVSFTHLTYLEVYSCDGLKNLMAPSTAKSLVQLTTMKVSYCDELKEIVGMEGNEQETVVDIQFGKLITIELDGLRNMTSFCGSNKCRFSFPSLENLILRNCPKMRTFTEGHIISAPKLQNMLVATEGGEEEKWYWEGDLNATVKMVYGDQLSFEYTSRLELSHHPELEQVWCSKDLVQENKFWNIKTLVLEKCGYLVHGIPYHLLPCFKNLEQLKICSCLEVKVIFNIRNDNPVPQASRMSRLKKLSLSDLPKLEHVWDKDPQGIIGLQVLQDLSICECNSLKYVFPASVAKDLAMLKMLSVENCEQLVEIFWEDEKATKSFVFRFLTSLKLIRLPGLKYFHRGLRMLEFPVLKELELHPSKWVILCEEADACVEDQILIPFEKVKFLMCSLEKLSFDAGDATVTWDLNSQKLEIESFKELSDNGLYQFLQMVPNVEELELIISSFEEMFSAERLNTTYAGALSHLKVLRLYSISGLKSIGLEHSWIHSISENLQTLELERCGDLKNIVPCTFSFSNLTNLVVSDCYDLLYLFTSSTAKSLAQLKRMEIRECSSLQEIVSKEEDESAEGGNITFEQLQALDLEELAELRCFYSGDLTLCFPSLELERVSISGCLLMNTFCPHIKINQDSNKLSGVGPIKGWEGNLNTTIRKMYEKEIAESACKVKHLKLGGSSHFQKLWDGSMPVPDACFSNLESLVVDGCEFLSQVLPSTLLPFLNKMQKLEVRNCSSVKTIFGVKMGQELLTLLPFSLNKLVLEKLPNLESVWNKDPDDGVPRVQLLQEINVAKRTNMEFTFPYLSSLTLLDLPKLKCFYCSLHCVELKTLTGQEPHIEDQVCVKEVTPNLDNLSIGENELRKIWHEQCEGNHLHKVKVIDLQVFNVESGEFPYGFLQKVPNIEKLVVSNSSLKEIFCSERPNEDCIEFLSQLKVLKLRSLSELISIGLEHSWVELKNLETLKARRCSRLRKLVPSFVCFSNLMHLKVSDCDDMMHLLTSSTAKSLARLETMVISLCKSIEEIVSKEGDEPHHDDEIIFGQLRELDLKYLQNLRSFCNGSYTLSFPSLENLSVIECNRMDTFCAGTINANKLSAVQLYYGDATPLEVDLNSTIHKAFKEKVTDFVMKSKDLNLVDHPEVHEIWHGSFPIPFTCFIKLKSLIVERCDFLSNAIPSHILSLLSNLEELEVRKCDSVKAIFEVKDIAKDTKKPTFWLKKLTLEQLPKLELVWDSDPHEGIGLMKNLQQVYVQGCDSLKRLFPASVTENLVKLEKLEVKQCGTLVEIVAKNEAAAEGTLKEFVFPCMTSIKLWDLPELKCFYAESYKLECPKLKQVQLLHCDKLKTFTCESQSIREAQPEYKLGNQLDTQALFLAEKVIANLEFLAITKQMAMMIWHGQFHVNLFHKLQALQLQCFHDASDTFPYGLLQKLPNIDKLVVSCSSFKEIFCAERPNMDCAEEIPSHLKCLQLSSLSELNSIGLEHSWMDPISRNLEKLQIDECHCLRSIVPCMVSFSSLIDLNVSQCHGLTSLFTPSTSRTLLQLKNMSVKNCESLEQIVSEEVEKSSSDINEEEKIIFKKLRTLSLHSLPRLGRFYNGSVALSFPSLDEISVIDCSRMDSFCAAPLSVNKCSTLQFRLNQYRAVPLVVDLNTTIRKLFDGTLLGQFPFW